MKRVAWFLNLSPATIPKLCGKCHNVIKHRASGGFEEKKKSNLSTVKKAKGHPFEMGEKRVSPYHLFHEHKKMPEIL